MEGRLKIIPSPETAYPLNAHCKPKLHSVKLCSLASFPHQLTWSITTTNCNEIQHMKFFFSIPPSERLHSIRQLTPHMAVQYISSVKLTQFLNPLSFTGHLNPPELCSLRIAFVTHWIKRPKHPLGFASSVPPETAQISSSPSTFHQFFSGDNTVKFWRFWEILCNSKKKPQKALSKSIPNPYTTTE